MDKKLEEIVKNCVTHMFNNEVVKSGFQDYTLLSAVMIEDGFRVLLETPLQPNHFYEYSKDPAETFIRVATYTRAFHHITRF